MIEQRTRIIAIEGDYALVEGAANADCGACAASRGCGVSKLGKLVRQRSLRWRVANRVAAAAGDEVTLGIADEALLASAAIAYLPPLLGLVAGALIAAAASGGNLGAALGAAFGFGLGCAISRRLAARHAARCAPRMIARAALAGGKESGK